MKITVFADAHYFAADIREAIFNKTEKPVRYALPLLDGLIKKTDTDLAVNLGDIIQDTVDRERDLNALKFMFERLKNFKCPCHSVLGNHDLKMMNSAEEVEAVLGHESTYSLDKEGWHLVFLSPEARVELGTKRGGCYKAQYLSEKSLFWLEDNLARNTLPCLIFTHYGVAEDSTVDDECMFMKNRDSLKEIIKRRKNVKAVFSGHQHRTRRLREGEVDYYVIPSLISDKEYGNHPSRAYAVIETRGEEIDVSFHEITKKEVGEIPPEEE